MKQVHLKLLLCLLLATTATGQLNTGGQFGQNFGGQQLGLGQSSMSGWGGFSGMGAFQPGAQSQFNAGLSQLGQQPGATSLGGGFGNFGGGFGQTGMTSQFGGGLGQAGMGSQFGGGLGQAGMTSQFGGGLGQAGMGSQFGGGLGQAGIGSQFGGRFGQTGMGSQFGGGLGQTGMGSQFGGGLGQTGMGSQFGGGLGQFGGASQFGGGLGQFGGGLGQFGQQQGASFGQAGVAQQATQPVAQQVTQPVAQQATQPVPQQADQSDVTSGTTQPYSSSVAVPATGDSRSVSNNVCFNIIDSDFPSFTDYCSVLPQTTFSLPNFFGHQSKQQTNDLLVSLTPVFNSQCFKHLRMFVCPLFFPPCDGEPILPCASVCRAVQSRCGGFDLSAINCDQLPEKSEFCPTITTVSRPFVPPMVPTRTLPSNNYDQQGSYSNDYSGSSSLTRSSSSYGGASNDLVQTPVNGGGYGGAGNFGTGYNRATLNSAQFPQGPKVAPIVNVPSQSSDINTLNQGWTIGDLSATSSSGGYSRAAPSLMKSGSAGYGSDNVGLQQDNSVNTGSYGAPTSINLVKSVGPTSYGSSIDNSRTLSNVASSNYGGVSSPPIVGPTSYGSSIDNSRTLSNVDSSNYGGVSSPPIVGPTSYGSNIDNSRTLSNVASSNYGGVASAPIVGPTSYGSNIDNSRTLSNVASSNYGSVSSPPIVGPTSYGSNIDNSRTLSFGANSNYGSGASARIVAPLPLDNNIINGGGLSYGNTIKSYGSSYDNTAKSLGPLTLQPTGSPYGIQSTRDLSTFTQEQLDISKCGPIPTQSPCSQNGPQFFPIPGVPQCYIQCVFDTFAVKPCPSFLVWNPKINVCDWPATGDNSAIDNTLQLPSIAAKNNNYGPSTFSINRDNSGSGSSYSYGRKKRSTAERKKRFFPGGGPPIVSEVPLGPPVPGLVPLPGFLGPIGVPGPLIPPPFFPPFLPPFFPPILPPFLPPISPIPPPILPPPFLPPLLPPFLPPLIPPLPIPLGGPLLPPLPMSLPATFIPGPPPLFGPPFLPPFGGPFGGPFGPLGGPIGGPIGEPFGPFGGPLGGFGGPLGGFGGPLGGFGGPLGGFGGPIGEFGGPLGGFGGFGGPFGGFGGPLGEFGGPLGGFGGPFGGFGGPFGGFGGPFGGEPFFDDPFGADFSLGGGFPFADNFGGLFGGFDTFGGFGGKGNKKGGYGKSYSSYNDDGDSDYGYSGGSNYKKNGNFQNFRKKRQYGLNVDQDTSLPTMNQQRILPKGFQLGYSPIQKLSYGSINQQPRVLASNTFQQQSQLPTEPISQPLVQPSPCVGKSSKSNIPHPTDQKKYISCLTEQKYEIMDCPTGLFYNPVADQCEKIKNSESVCQREHPCLNDGQCYQTSSTTYKCTCRGSWTGEHCETPLSSCTSNPCGEGNECHTLITSDYKQDFVCVCDGRQSYGLTCGRNTVPNPCLATSNNDEQYYPFAFSAHAYVQCNGDILYVRPCSTGLFWNQDMKICDRVETSPARPAEDQPQSYQIKYNNRPIVNLADQNVDKQQGYRYRNYNPHIVSNDQSTTYNQINSQQETPIINSYSSSSLNTQPNRQFQDQQQFTPVLTQQQQPVITNQQYGQQSQTPVFQGTPQRASFRFFQSSPSRTSNNLNTQSPSSSYRR